MPWTCSKCEFTNWINKTLCYNCAQKRVAHKVKKIVDRNQLKLKFR